MAYPTGRANEDTSMSFPIHSEEFVVYFGLGSFKRGGKGGALAARAYGLCIRTTGTHEPLLCVFVANGDRWVIGVLDVLASESIQER